MNIVDIIREMEGESNKDRRGDTMKIIVVTRHQGAVDWLRYRGVEFAMVLPQLNEEDIESGVTYIGVLPIPLIVKVLNAGSRFILLSLPAIAFSQRGQELTPEEMDKAGARLDEVKTLILAPVTPGMV